MLANCRSQFLLDRLGRCLKLFVSTDSISCHEFASQFGLAIFYKRKTSKTSGKSGHQRVCLFECQQNRRKEALIPSRLGATNPSKLTVCVRVCVRACVPVCACVSGCLHDVFAIYDNISHSLIMIIIKIIILYFIQIRRHTDDFPSMSTRLVYLKKLHFESL